MLSISIYLMSVPRRVLTGNHSLPAPPPAEQLAVDSDFVVILAALLCAIICVVGLVAVARCGWIRRLTGAAPVPPNPAANKGLKKKILRSLPRMTFNGEINGKLADCAICLTEFADGDEIRVLPQCGHGFHVTCIDTWLGSHSSCPSCRKILVVKRCKKCGGVPESSTSSTGASSSSSSRPQTEAELKAREDNDVNRSRFLP